MTTENLTNKPITYELYTDFKLGLAQFYHDFPGCVAIIVVVAALLCLRKIFKINASDFINGIIREFFNCYKGTANKVEALDAILLIMIFFAWIILYGFDPIAKYASLAHGTPSQKNVAEIACGAFVIVSLVMFGYLSVRLCALKK